MYTVTTGTYTAPSEVFSSNSYPVSITVNAPAGRVVQGAGVMATTQNYGATFAVTCSQPSANGSSWTVQGVISQGLSSAAGGQVLVTVTVTTSPATVYLSSTFVGTTGTASQSVTGLSAALGAGTYLVEGLVGWLPTGTDASTHVDAFTFSGTATGSITGSSTCSTVTSSGSSETFTTGITSATHSAGGGYDEISLYLVVTVAGTLQLAVTNTTSADTVNFLLGSYLQITQVA